MTYLSPSSIVLIATFSPWKNGKRLPINGNLEPLRDFFVKRSAKTILIDQVYPGSDFVLPRYEVYEKSLTPKMVKVSWWMNLFEPFLRKYNTGGTHTIFKIRDFLSVLDICIREKKSLDLFIGLEAINALAGICMRALGKIKIVVYYVSDYSPNRYPSRFFNTVYLWLDRFCAMHADFIWDVSKAMQPARIEAGLNPKNSAPILHVPNALYPQQIHQSPLSTLIPYSLVFMGTLGENNGPDIAIRSIPFLLPKLPKVILHIVGGGKTDLERLKNLVQSLHIEKYIIFHGFISDRIEVSKLIRNYMIALAPYPAIKGSARMYGDATKIRAYLAAGLPVVTTDVPPLGKEVAKAGGALIVDDTPKGIADAVVEIFSKPVLFASMRKKSLLFAKHNTWENVFQKAILQMKDLTE